MEILNNKIVGSKDLLFNFLTCGVYPSFQEFPGITKLNCDYFKGTKFRG